MNTETVLSIIASLSLGGVIATFFSSYLSSRDKINESNFKFKEQRYKAIMILMWTSLSPKSELKHLKIYRPDIPNSKTLLVELKLELYNALLYAGDDVIISLKKFIANTNHKTYSEVALQMRKDLFGKKTSLNFEDIEISL